MNRDALLAFLEAAKRRDSNSTEPIHPLDWAKLRDYAETCHFDDPAPKFVQIATSSTWIDHGPDDRGENTHLYALDSDGVVWVWETRAQPTWSPLAPHPGRSPLEGR